MDKRIAVAAIFSLILGGASCSGADRDTAAGTAEGAGVAAGDLDRRRLVALIDRRIALALARERAARDARAGEARVRIAVEQAGRAVRSQLERTRDGGGERAGEFAELAARIDALSGKMDELERDEAALEAVRSEVQGVLEEIRAGGYGAQGEEGWPEPETVETGAYAWEDEGSWTEAGPPVGGEGELPFLGAVSGNLSRALAILDQVKEAKAALAEVVSGRIPESGDYAYDDYGYDEAAYGEDWYEEEAYEEGWEEEYADDPSAPEDPAGGELPEEAQAVDLAASDEGAAAGAGAPAVEHDTRAGVFVEVLALRRTAGGTLTLELAVVNRTGENVELRHLFGGTNWWNLSKVGLVDMGTGERYPAMQDSDGNLMGSKGGYEKIPDGERLELWVRFAGVPPDLGVVSVNVPGFPLIDGIRIGR